MRTPVTLLLAAWLALAGPAIVGAETTLIGKYKGMFEIERVAAVQNVHPVLVHTELTILRVEGEVVQATWGVYPPGRVQCRGEFVMRGWYRAGELFLRNPDPPEEGCGRAPLRLKRVGDRFVGSFARWEIDLSRD